MSDLIINQENASYNQHEILFHFNKIREKIEESTILFKWKRRAVEL